MTTAMLVRNTDPTTSHMAAASVETSRVSNRDRMLKAYDDTFHGLTAEEAGQAAGLLHTGYWKRVSELIQLGFIAQSEFEEMRPGRSGRYQRVMHITEAGQHRLDEIASA